MKASRAVLLALAILALVILACVAPGWTVTPTALAIKTATARATPKAALTAQPGQTKLPTLATSVVWTARVRMPVVNYRDEPGGVIIGNLQAGESVTIKACVEVKVSGATQEWCEITEPVSGYVFRGCLTDNPDKKGCTAE